jgi:hypothetical protein
MEIIEIVIASAVGIISSVTIKLVDSYRTKKKQADDHAEAIAESAKANVDSANVVNTMMREMLDQEREYFQKELVRASGECEDKISKLKAEYDIQLDTIRSDNEAFAILIDKVTKDNLRLTKQIVSLTASKEENAIKIRAIRERLSKYESITTSEIEALAKAKDIK